METKKQELPSKKNRVSFYGMRSALRSNMTPSYCTFYLVRHGETEGNVKEIIQGHTDSPLTEALDRSLRGITRDTFL